MSKLIMMRGLPASGKSTHAAELLKDYGNAIRLNRDLLRKMLHFGVWSGKKEGDTVEAEKQLAHLFLTQGKVVIIDDTNLAPRHEQLWRAMAASAGAEFATYDLDTDWLTCLKRDQQRDDRVGNHVIYQMAREYGRFEFDKEEVIVDIDGTLADLTHRKHFIETTPKDWKGFFANVGDDAPRHEIIDRVRELAKVYRVILVSGRPDSIRKETEVWLARVGVPYEALFMRRADDKRPDTEVKHDIARKYFDLKKVRLVIDDRPSVIRMWRELGLEVEDVGEGVEF